jgi:hypothetical protein
VFHVQHSGVVGAGSDNQEAKGESGRIGPGVEGLLDQKLADERSRRIESQEVTRTPVEQGFPGERTQRSRARIENEPEAQALPPSTSRGDTSFEGIAHATSEEGIEEIGADLSHRPGRRRRIDGSSVAFSTQAAFEIAQDPGELGLAERRHET